MNTLSNIPNRIVISGLAGAGKSSVGKALAAKLGYEFCSVGNFAREEAKKRGVTIQQFQEICKIDPQIDRKMDDDFVNWGKSKINWVMDYRLGFALIPEATSIYLKVENSIAATRILSSQRPEEFVDSPSYEEVVMSMHERNEKMRLRWMETYEIDFTQSERYDHVISNNNRPIEYVVSEIISCLS